MKHWREILHIHATFYGSDDQPEDDLVVVVGERVLGLTATPLWCGAAAHPYPMPLLVHMADGVGWRALLEHEESALLSIVARVQAPDSNAVGVVTVWACEAGMTYVPGEADEWECDAQLVGYLDPATFVEVAL